MKYKWSKKAKIELSIILDYCVKIFGFRIASRFLKNIDRTVSLLAANQCMGAIEPLLEGRKNVYRSLVVHKHFKLIYYIDNDTLYIVDIWDVRREPDTLVHRV